MLYSVLTVNQGKCVLLFLKEQRNFKFCALSLDFIFMQIACKKYYVKCVKFYSTYVHILCSFGSGVIPFCLKSSLTVTNSYPCFLSFGMMISNASGVGCG